MDLGTGDGRAAARLAASAPDVLVVGVDANASALADVSRRGAASIGKGGLPNLIFVRASAEAPPHELVGRADRVRVAFPWGSLARGILGHDDAALAGVAALLSPGGSVEVFVSVMERDAAGLGIPPAAIDDPDAIAAAWARHGLTLASHRIATDAELRGLGSTWTRRLMHDGRRRVARLGGYRSDGGVPGGPPRPGRDRP